MGLGLPKMLKDESIILYKNIVNTFWSTASTSLPVHEPCSPPPWLHPAYYSASVIAATGFGAILSRVEFQTGPYKTSHFKYLKNITVGLYLKQNFVVNTFTRCQAKLSESRF